MTSGPGALGAAFEDDGPTLWRDRGFWSRAGQASVGLWVGHAAILGANIIVARSFSVDGYGAVVLAVAVVSILSGVLDLTLDEAVVYHGIRADEAGERGKLRGLLRAAFILDLMIGAVVWLVLVAVAAPVAGIVSRDGLDPDLLRVASLFVLAGTVDGTAGGALLIAGKPQVRVATIGLAGVLRLGLVIIAVRSGSESAVLLAFAGGVAGAAVVQLALAWYWMWRPLRDEPVVGGVRMWAAPLFRFGVHTSLTTTLGSAGAAIVPIALARTAGVAAAGVVAVAMFPVTAVVVGSAPLRAVLLPVQARLWASGNTASLRRVLNQYTMVALGVGVVGSALAWFVLPWLIPTLYTDRYDVAVWPARILLIAAVARLATIWSKNFPAAIGRPQLRTWVSGLELGIVMGLVLMLGRHGASGAAWAISAGYGTTGVVWWALSRTMTEPEPCAE